MRGWALSMLLVMSCAHERTQRTTLAGSPAATELREPEPEPIPAADAGAGRSLCGTAPAMRARGGCCMPSDLQCMLAGAKPVPKTPTAEDPAPEQELEACSADCRAGNADHCNRVAESYRQGKGAPRDVLRAGRFFGEACRLGLERACEELWMIFERDRNVRVGPAVRAFEQECMSGRLLLRCGRAALAYDHGWDVPRDRERARKIYTRACQTACGDQVDQERASCLRHVGECQAARRLGQKFQ